MSERLCKCGCSEVLDPGASLQMLYRPRHRQRRYQRERDARVRKALAAVAGAADVKMTAAKGGRGRKRRLRKSSPARYALVQISGSTIEVLGFDVGSSKRAVEGAFGIRGRDDLAAVAERYLPPVA